MNNFDDNEVRWGVVGVGDVCEVKSAPAMNIVPDSRLVAVMRRDGALAEDYAHRHSVPRWYDDADKLIADPDINAVYIATPPNAHREIAMKAAAAGKPVYVEKPMARTHAECRDMMEACATAGVPLFVAYYRRALPHFLKARELIETGTIGDIRHVRLELNQRLAPPVVGHREDNWRVVPAIAGGGYFFDLASHQLDLLDFLLGPITNAVGFNGNQAGQYDAEDIVAAALEFESGVLGSGTWCFSTSAVSEVDRTTIVGSKGEIEFAVFGAGEVLARTEVGDETFRFDLPAHIQEPLIKSVVDDLLGRGRCVSTGDSGARTNRVMDMIVNRA